MIPPWRKKKYTNLLLCGFLRVLLVRWRCWCRMDGWMDDTPTAVVRRILVGKGMVYGMFGIRRYMCPHYSSL
jgi:hypothetical protein